VLITLGLWWLASHKAGLGPTLRLRTIDATVDLGIFYPLFLYLVVAGATNAVNLTDGLDGLAAGCSAIVLLTYLGITFINGDRDLSLLAGCLVGGCIGFLWFNAYPATVFMGDTGSLGLGGAIVRNDDGDWTTRTHDGACILLNRADHPGGIGCALHVAAMEAGVGVVAYKPAVCWQLPLRLVYDTDELGHTTYTLREWKRRDWGEGGAELHWWCTEGPEAFTAQSRVLDTLREEIVGLVGEQVYRRLVVEIDRSGASGTPVAHPARRTGA